MINSVDLFSYTTNDARAWDEKRYKTVVLTSNKVDADTCMYTFAFPQMFGDVFRALELQCDGDAAETFRGGFLHLLHDVIPLDFCMLLQSPKDGKLEIPFEMLYQESFPSDLYGSSCNVAVHLPNAGSECGTVRLVTACSYLHPGIYSVAHYEGRSYKSSFVTKLSPPEHAATTVLQKPAGTLVRKMYIDCLGGVSLQSVKINGQAIPFTSHLRYAMCQLSKDRWEIDVEEFNRSMEIEVTPARDVYMVVANAQVFLDMKHWSAHLPPITLGASEASAASAVSRASTASVISAFNEASKASAANAAD